MMLVAEQKQTGQACSCFKLGLSFYLEDITNFFWGG